MFDGYIEQLIRVDFFLAGLLGQICRGQSVIQCLAHLPDIFADLSERRPIGRLVSRQSTVYRVNAKCKKMIEFRVKSGPCQETFAYQVPIERFQVSDIKNNPVPLRDRPLVEEFWLDMIE